MRSGRHSIAAGPAVHRVLARLERGTVLVLGGPGTGKTSLAGYLTAQLGRGLSRVAQLDADPAQGAIGLGACLGLALTAPWRAPAALWFAGHTSALERPLATVVGTTRLAARARGEGAELVVIDPPGTVATAEGRDLLYHLAEAAGVDQVVALERGDELDALVDALGGRAEIYRLAPLAGARPVADEERRAGLEARLKAHLAGGERHRFGRARIVTAGWAQPQEVAPGTVVGLLERAGFCLGLGVIEELGRASVEVLAPHVDRSRIAHLQLGDLRCERPEGRSEDAPAAELRLLRAG
jgi:polynucleotide 5'-kinase involved in rRNA processing